jgi:hypothetical protein
VAGSGPAPAPPLRSWEEAEELIAGQYADRPQLWPALDAVLAALPAIGPATVQARKTLISLLTPRRTFAVIQATTKSRVDLGLRLDHESPGGRLLPARDLGAATVRIPLTRPEDVDADVLGWLRRAYQENAAPPPPRRPARYSAPVLGPGTRAAHRGDRRLRPARPDLRAGTRRAGAPEHPRRTRRPPQGQARAGRESASARRAGQTWAGDRAGARRLAVGALGSAGHRAARHRRLRFQRAVRAWRPYRPPSGPGLGRGSRRRHAAAVPRRQAPARGRRSRPGRGSHAPRGAGSSPGSG